MIKENIWKYKEKEKIDKKALLKKLALDIANKYDIKETEAERLIKSETLNNIWNLKSEIQENEKLKLLAKKELEKLFFTLKWALDLVENMSKLKIKVLKDELEKSSNINNFVNKLEEYLPEELTNKAKNPKKVHEHILWITLGSANTIISTTEVLFKIWTWLLKTPYDLYLIINWKWKISNFKKI